MICNMETNSSKSNLSNLFCKECRNQFYFLATDTEALQETSFIEKSCLN